MAEEVPIPVEPQARALRKVGPSWLRWIRSDWVLWPLVFAILYFVMRPAPSGPPAGTRLGSPLLVDVSTGKRVELPKEGPMLIEVFASWCGACKRANSMLGTLGTPDLPYYMVSVDEHQEDARAAKRQWPIDGVVLFSGDGRVSREWKIEVLPTFILVNADGEVTRVSSGLPGALDLHAFSEAAKSRKKP